MQSKAEAQSAGLPHILVHPAAGTSASLHGVSSCGMAEHADKEQAPERPDQLGMYSSGADSTSGTDLLERRDHHVL